MLHDLRAWCRSALRIQPSFIPSRRLIFPYSLITDGRLHGWRGKRRRSAYSMSCTHKPSLKPTAFVCYTQLLGVSIVDTAELNKI